MSSRMPVIAGLFATLATQLRRSRQAKRLALPFARHAILAHNLGSRRGAASSFLFAIFCALRGP